MHPIDALDQWLRSEFTLINTALEEAYFEERTDLILGRPDLDFLKATLSQDGGERILAVARISALPSGGAARYRLLGLVGHYLAACRRHEIDLAATPGAREAAWTLSLRLGGALNVAPRLVFAHQCLFNEAVAGRFRTFTTLPDERAWIELNGLAVIAYRRAATALADIPGLGVSNPMTLYLLEQARAELGDVLDFNRRLSKRLDVDRFYLNIRPYFKSYRVGAAEYRGANAGDFSAVNEIDVRLGLCRTEDPFYQTVVHEKSRHVPPGDQPALQALGDHVSLLDAFVEELDRWGPTPGWKANASAFLAACKAHGAAYAWHHQRLVKPFLEKPARAAPSVHPAGITSSGPPLAEVIGSLKRLLDLRTGRDIPGGWSAAPQLDRLRAALRG